MEQLNKLKEHAYNWYYWACCRKARVYTLSFNKEPIVELAVFNDNILGYKVSDRVSKLLIKSQKLNVILEEEEEKYD